MKPWNKEEAMQDRRGFTLLELLMVVIIIAILATIALPTYLKTAERSRAAEALQNLASIRSSESRYKAGSATNVYTGTLTDLDIGVPVGTNWNFTANNPANYAAATRNDASGREIRINMDTGALCGKAAAEVSDYGLPAVCP